MSRQVTIRVNGTPTTVAAGTSVAVAVFVAGQTSCRESVSHTPRGPVCGMGICAECRVTIDGEPHRRSCLICCVDGMEVTTHA